VVAILPKNARTCGMVKIANFLQLKNVQVYKNGVKIIGLYGLSIAYSDLVQVDTTYSILRIRLRTNEYAFGKTMIGNFKLSDKIYVKLFIKHGYAPYVRIILKGQLPKTLDLDSRLTIKKWLSPTLCLFNDGGCSVFCHFSS
jgi:hypothetical protein